MVVAKKWIYAKAFSGFPTVNNFRLEQETIDAKLKDNEFFAEAIYLSVDPYMRTFMPQYPEGTVMIGCQVAKVLDSKNPHFPTGTYVVGAFGWRTHSVCKPDEVEPEWKPYPLPDFSGEPLSLGIGALGMTGQTAYFGFLKICKPKEGETVVVSAAAGAVGSLLGQIAKIKGCKVIGIAGTDAKCEWIKSLGFEHAINYKTADVEAELRNASPEGVDCYFDNVGGRTAEIVHKQMNRFGRIAVCGSISDYNSEVETVRFSKKDFASKKLKREEFSVFRWNDQRSEAIEQILKWIKEGRIKCRETITEGFENMPQAFMGMLAGENIGKAVVKA
ncbi:prostaglandin reductase 1 [Aedes aegypti]|uniref:Prostaglandin reductase 1 n=1 Tax=Aedes aegypti TaxID=7159 RepID=A0A1S4F552_AEDAE|nr:prostaglandin reductase 1 [Aedes aegypti]